MGTTFTNLQIKTCDKNILEEQLTSEFYYLQTAEEWFTVLEKDSERDFDRMTKLGQQLSKTTEGPVLLVHYFDDDVFELHLLSKGNKLGSYQAENSRNFCQKSAAFIEALGLSAKEAQAFRYLIKQEMSPSESIHWLSRLFGARLYADKGLLGNKKKLWRKDTAAVLSEIAAEKKAAKVINRTDLILLEEALGENIQDSNILKDMSAEERQEKLMRINQVVTCIGDYDYDHSTYDDRIEKVDVSNRQTFEERKIVAEYHYEDERPDWFFCYAKPLCVLDDRIVVLRLRDKVLSMENMVDVRFFDFDLKLLRKEQIPVAKMETPYNFCYDEDMDTVFLSQMAINLGTHEIVTCSAKIKEGDILHCLDGRKNVYVLSGHSLYVLSADMKLLSRHMLKGTLKYHYKNAKGNMCLITKDDDTERESQSKTGSVFRLYEVVEKEFCN